MDLGKEMTAIFPGQVKTCRGGSSTQWKSGYVGVSRLEDGALCARMYLNVMPSKVYSQINVKLSGLSVKSNRVVIEDSKGPGMYVKLGSSKEVEESRRAISRLASVETPKRNKAEVGLASPLVKSLPPSSAVSKQPSSTPPLSWTKIVTPKTANKTRESSCVSETSGHHSTSGLKRRSAEMENGDIDKLYNDENQQRDRDVGGEATGSQKLSLANDIESIRGLRTNSFYGKKALASPGFPVQSPRSRVRERAVSSVKKGLYSSSMTVIEESPNFAAQIDEVESGPAAVPESAGASNGTDAAEENSSGSSIVGFDNLGNTCFINSPLQCLAYLEPLSLDIQEVVGKYGRRLKAASIIRLLYFLMKDVRKCSASRNPERVRRILTRLRQLMHGKFAANTQQDAHELLSEILDRCHEEVQDLMKDGSQAAEVELSRSNRMTKGHSPPRYILSPTETNFSWFFKNNFHLQKCKHQTSTQEEHDTTMMLALTSQPDLHLQDCLDNYFKGSDVDMKCEHCNQPEKATLTRKIVRRPRCLILNLLRYCTDNQDTKKKMDRVTIPRYISIVDFCEDDAKPPLYMPPSFMAERVVSGNKSAEENSGSFVSCAPRRDPVRQEKDSHQEASSNFFEESTSGSRHTTAEDDSVFGAGSEMTNISVGADASSLLDYNTDDVAAERFGKMNNSVGDSHVVGGGGDDDDDDGVVSFRPRVQGRQERFTVAVKCRGGSVKNGLGQEDMCGEDFLGGEEMRRAAAMNVDGNGDFVPVGEMERKMAAGSDADDEEESGRSLSVPTSQSVSLSDFGAEETFDIDECASIDSGVKGSAGVQYDGDDDDNGNARSAVAYPDSRRKVADASVDCDPNSSDEEAFMDLGDVATNYLCGKHYDDFTEEELASLDIGGLTEHESLLYAQALSKIEYARENRSREEKRSLEVKEEQSELMAGDFVYNQDFLIEAEKELDEAKDRSLPLANIDDIFAVAASPIKKVRGLGGIVSEGESVSNREVPDILSSVSDVEIGLLCDENLEDADKSQSISQLDSFPSVPALADRCLFCKKVLVGCECPNCSMGGVDFGTLRSDVVQDNLNSATADLGVKEENLNSVVPGVLSDKRNCKPLLITKSNLSMAIDSFNRKEETVKTDSFDSKKIERLGKSPTPTNSNSRFTKPSTDLCFIPSPKNKNLVKTRDYSRLRSPSASPKKKNHKLSPLKKTSASKQLRFSDEISQGENAKSDHCTLHKTPEKPTLVRFQNSTPDSGENALAEPIRKAASKPFSRALLFGEDEVDSMNNNGSSPRASAGSLYSTSPLQAVNTSTPMMSSTITSPASQTVSVASANSTNLNSSFSATVTNHVKSDAALPTKLSYDDISTEGEESVDGIPGESRDSVTKHGACAPVQEGSLRRPVNRILLNGSSAGGKENSTLSSQEKQARRKRISHIEQGEADCSYRLVGMVSHHGESLFAGHYTCSSYNLYKQRWYHMDDKHTRETTESAIRRDSSTTGYVFFYMDKDLYDSYTTVRSRGSSSHHPMV